MTASGPAGSPTMEAPGTALLDAAWRRAQAGGYLQHELGDLCLIAPGLAQADQAA